MFFCSVWESFKAGKVARLNMIINMDYLCNRASLPVTAQIRSSRPVTLSKLFLSTDVHKHSFFLVFNLKMHISKGKGVNLITYKSSNGCRLFLILSQTKLIWSLYSLFYSMYILNLFLRCRFTFSFAISSSELLLQSDKNIWNITITGKKHS